MKTCYGVTTDRIIKFSVTWHMLNICYVMQILLAKILLKLNGFGMPTTTGSRTLEHFSNTFLTHF